MQAAVPVNVCTDNDRMSLRPRSLEQFNRTRHCSSVKTLVCRLIAVLALGLSSAIFAAGQEDLDHDVTGTIVELSLGSATLDTGHGGPFYIGLENNVGSHLKVGQKVTLHCYVTGRGKLIADKVEKAVKARKNPRTDKAGG